MSSVPVISLGNSLSVYNAMIPAEGPRSLPLRLDFSASPTYNLQFAYGQLHAALSMVQTVFVDMSGTDQPLTITIPATSQVITVKGRTQGYYPIVCPNPITMTFACSDMVTVPLQLLNVPIFGSQWVTQ